MNQVIDVLLKRKSVREYTNQPIPAEVKAQILAATFRAPTAGNMMLYSILEVTDQALKDKLAVTCDNQPFIATAPLIWMFLADYQRWFDYFLASGVEDLCERRGLPLRHPEEGDLLLACCDTMIAAQSAVVAAESFGIGSCYIGDILEDYETHRAMFNLPQYVAPVGLLCFGYPTREQSERVQTPRFDEKFVVFENQYQRLNAAGFEEMFREREARRKKSDAPDAPANVGQAMYLRKFSAAFSIEMTRSVRAMLKNWASQ